MISRFLVRCFELKPARFVSLMRVGCENHFLDHGEAVFFAQVTVHFHRQSTTIFVTEPAANRGNIHTGLDAGGGEEMTEVSG